MEFIKNFINRICFRQDNININPPDIIEYISDTDIKMNECIICLEEFKKNETVSIIKCGHMYHTNCLYTWFLTKAVCPLCDEILDIK